MLSSEKNKIKKTKQQHSVLQFIFIMAVANIYKLFAATTTNWLKCCKNKALSGFSYFSLLTVSYVVVLLIVLIYNQPTGTNCNLASYFAIYNKAIIKPAKGIKSNAVEETQIYANLINAISVFSFFACENENKYKQACTYLHP